MILMMISFRFNGLFNEAHKESGVFSQASKWLAAGKSFD